MKTALTTSIAFIVAFVAGGSYLGIYKAKRWELRDQTQRQERILETYKNRNLLNSAENGRFAKKKRTFLENTICALYLKTEPYSFRRGILHRLLKTHLSTPTKAGEIK